MQLCDGFQPSYHPRNQNQAVLAHNFANYVSNMCPHADRSPSSHSRTTTSDIQVARPRRFPPPERRITLIEDIYPHAFWLEHYQRMYSNRPAPIFQRFNHRWCDNRVNRQPTRKLHSQSDAAEDELAHNSQDSKYREYHQFVSSRMSAPPPWNRHANDAVDEPLLSSQV